MKYTLQKTQLVNYGAEFEVPEHLLNQRNKVKVQEPQTIVRFCKEVLNLHLEPNENVLVFALNAKLEVISVSPISSGSINGSFVEPRNIFRFLFLANAASFIIVHNHPSGDCSPSLQDEQLTEHLKENGKLLGVKMNDHIIIGDMFHYSFHQNQKFSI